MVIHVKFIAVFGRGDRQLLDTYLYGHTNVVNYDELNKGYFHATLRTEADTDDRADYLANYQAQRLQSGLLAARVSDTEEAAQDNIVDMVIPQAGG